MPAPSEPSDPLAVAAEIVAAYVLKNRLSAAELPGLIKSVHAAVSKITSGGEAVSNPPAVSAPSASAIRNSITPDYVVCFDDGLKFQSMRRHLTLLGMTPDEYRAKWKLPADYPMVAPKYAARRAELAKQSGLGRKRTRRN
jgi:predicted transcriptional regulator